MTEFDIEKSKLVGRYRRVTTPEKEIILALRKNATLAENILWKELSNKKLKGYKFRRQHKVGPYIADFYCHKAGLVIEVDGGYHYKQEDKDALRNKWMEGIGLKVLRVSNEDIIDDLVGIKEKILAKIMD